MGSIRRLSKSKVMAGRQCPKRLWLDVFAPERAEISPDTERAFALGHEVGAMAPRLWPGGILIGHDQNLQQALKETAHYLSAPGPITLFEGTVRANGVLIRADVLQRDVQGAIHLVEVKASTSVKPYHLEDCAIQAWVLRAAGVSPTTVKLAHVNNQFVYAGDGNYEGLLTLQDVTDEVQGRLAEVPGWIETLRGVLDGQEPDIVIGGQCRKPYPCGYLKYCTPCQTDYPVTALPGGMQTAKPLLEEGIEDIREVPAGYLSSAEAEWVRAVTIAGQPELHPEAAETLADLGWPRYYFDFETVGPAVPIWAGTRPYQSLPFQWSCHIESEDGTLRHREFLAEGTDAPMRACAESLIAALGDEGPIVVYTDYEQSVLTEMARLFPGLAAPLEAVIHRLFDLYPVTRANYCHPAMLGSWSLKRVLPTVAPDLAYDTLGDIQEGMAASQAFVRLLREELTAEEQRSIREALKAYCKQDTLGLVRLAHFLGAGRLGAEGGGPGGAMPGT